MREAGYLIAQLDIPLPSVNWIRPWDTIATIALLLTVWFLVCFIMEIEEKEVGNE